MAPGWATERIHLFVADDLYELAKPPPQDDDEEVTVVPLAPRELARASDDAKTLVALARPGVALT